MKNHHQEFAEDLVANLVDEKQNLNKGQVIITVQGLLIH